MSTEDETVGSAESAESEARQKLRERLKQILEIKGHDPLRAQSFVTLSDKTLVELEEFFIDTLKPAYEAGKVAGERAVRAFYAEGIQTERQRVISVLNQIIQGMVSTDTLNKRREPKTYHVTDMEFLRHFINSGQTASKWWLRDPE